MAQLNIPNILVQGTTINAAPFNANFNAVQAAVNSVDNSQIGPAGIFASQIISTSNGNATFGGTPGYTFPSASAGATSLTVNAASSGGISLAVNTAGSGTGLFVGSGGSGNLLQVAGNLVVSSAGATQITTSGVAVTPLTVSMIASQSVPGLLINGAASITGNLLQVDLTSGGTHALQVAAGGVATFGFGVTASAGVNSGPQGAAPYTPNSGVIALFSYGSTTQGDAVIATQNGGATTATFWKGSSNVANINSSGTYSATSDARLKGNVTTIKYGLAAVMALKPSSFTWNRDGLADVGFIAQDVQQVVPEVVNDLAEYLGVNYSGLVPVAIKGIQDLSGIVDALTAAFNAYVVAHP